MKKPILYPGVVFAIVSLAGLQAVASGSRKNSLEGAWELVSGQPLPQGVRDIKIISGDHVIFVAYDTKTGKPLYTGGGTYILNGASYTEHIDFASDQISTGLVGQDQPFTLKFGENTFTQTGILSNGKTLSEVWKRID